MTRTERIGRIALGAFSWMILLLLAAPILIIVIVSFSPDQFMEFPPRAISFRWYEKYLSDPLWMLATHMSLVVASLTALISLVIGCIFSFAIVRGRFPGKRALQIFVVSPLVVPKIIIAVSLYFLYVKLRIVGTTFGLVAGHTVIAAPYVVMIVSSALFGFDRRLEWAAQSLGASPQRALWHVTFVILRPALISATLFAFIASFDDVILGLFLTKLTMPTLPRQIWVNVQEFIDPTIAAVSTLMTAISVLGMWTVAAVQKMGRRGAA